MTITKSDNIYFERERKFCYATDDRFFKNSLTFIAALRPRDISLRVLAQHQTFAKPLLLALPMGELMLSRPGRTRLDR